MVIEIKRWDGHVLYTAEHAQDVRAALREAVAQGADLQGAYLQGADLQGADLQGAYLQGAYLQGAYLQGADLQGAYLQGADLQGADLRGADLQGADLQGAYLQGADLQGADLQGAYGLSPERTDELRILLDQPGKVRAYKLVDKDGYGPYYGGIRYELRGTYEEPDADTSQRQCGAGINLATLPWCMSEWRRGQRILVAEFTARDIASIPHGTDGKFRVFRARIVGEKDLVELGLVEGEETPS